MCLTILHLPKQAAKTIVIKSSCLECGIISKSGKSSCCGRGGSWFGNCRSVGNTNLGHTWHEGIRVCKGRQFQAVAGQQLDAPEPKADTSSDDATIGTDLKAVIVAARTFASAPAETFASLQGTTVMTVPVNTSNTSIVALFRPSLPCDTGTATSEAIMATISTSTNTSADMPTLKAVSPQANGTIITPAKPTVTPSTYFAIMTSTQRDSANMFMQTPSLALSSTSIIARECEKLLHVVAHLSLIFIITWL